MNDYVEQFIAACNYGGWERKANWYERTALGHRFLAFKGDYHAYAHLTEGGLCVTAYTDRLKWTATHDYRVRLDDWDLFLGELMA